MKLFLERKSARKNIISNVVIRSWLGIQPPEEKIEETGWASPVKLVFRENGQDSVEGSD